MAMGYGLSIITLSLFASIYPVLFILYYMFQFNLHLKLVSQMPGHGIGCIHTAVLAAGAAKTYNQAFKPPLNIFFNCNINNIKNTVQKFRHLGLLLQKIYYFFIPAGLCFHAFNSSGI